MQNGGLAPPPRAMLVRQPTGGQYPASMAVVAAGGRVDYSVSKGGVKLWAVLLVFIVFCGALYSVLDKQSLGAIDDELDADDDGDDESEEMDSRPDDDSDDDDGDDDESAARRLRPHSKQRLAAGLRAKAKRDTARHRDRDDDDDEEEDDDDDDDDDDVRSAPAPRRTARQRALEKHMLDQLAQKRRTAAAVDDDDDDEDDDEDEDEASTEDDEDDDDDNDTNGYDEDDEDEDDDETTDDDNDDEDDEDEEENEVAPARRKAPAVPKRPAPRFVHVRLDRREESESREHYAPGAPVRTHKGAGGARKAARGRLPAVVSDDEDEEDDEEDDEDEDDNSIYDDEDDDEESGDDESDEVMPIKPAKQKGRIVHVELPKRRAVQNEPRFSPGQKVKVVKGTPKVTSKAEHFNDDEDEDDDNSDDDDDEDEGSVC